MGVPLNKAYRMSLSLVSDSRVTQSLWQHHTEPLTERNKQRYQNRGKTVILFENFSSRRNDCLIIYFYCPVKLYDKLRFFYRTANILLEDTMA